MVIGRVITPRNRLQNTAAAEPSTLVHICTTISAFSFSLLLKIFAQFTTVVTGDQQPRPLWTRRDETQTRAAFFATRIRVLQPWLITSDSCSLCAVETSAVKSGTTGIVGCCGGAEGTLSKPTQPPRCDCNGEKQRGEREPAHVRSINKGSFQRNHVCSPS